MKSNLLIITCAAGAVLLSACGKIGNGNSSADTGVTLSETKIEGASANGWTKEIFLTSALDWTASADAAWLTCSPSSGVGSPYPARVQVSVDPNTGEARTATMTVKNGKASAVLSVDQEAYAGLTIAEFRKKPVGTTDWHRLSGEITAVADDAYGSFYLADETGYVYVYGLTATRVDKNDQSFSKLGLKPGDKVTMMTLRSEYGGTVEAGGKTPAYYVSHTPGTYTMGSNTDAPGADWTELPVFKAGAGYRFLVHRFSDGRRSWSACWDPKHLVSRWVAYPLCVGNIGSGQRTDAWALDPLLPADEQPVLLRGYGKTSDGKSFDRGHQIPSADRLDWRVNLDTFFGTNMMPENNDLNAKLWGNVEKKLRDWAKSADTDTVFVVTGCTLDDSELKVLDNAGKEVTVPTACWKAVLRLDKDKKYYGLALWFANEPQTADKLDAARTMSIDELEAKTGEDFFANLPEDIEKAVEAQKPADEKWWWNH